MFTFPPCPTTTTASSSARATTPCLAGVSGALRLEGARPGSRPHRRRRAGDRSRIPGCRASCTTRIRSFTARLPRCRGIATWSWSGTAPLHRAGIERGDASPDGRSLEWWTDFDRTADSFAEFSPRDAAALRRWVDEFRPIVEQILFPEAQSPPLPPSGGASCSNARRWAAGCWRSRPSRRWSSCSTSSSTTSSAPAAVLQRPARNRSALHGFGHSHPGDAGGSAQGADVSGRLGPAGRGAGAPISASTAATC